mmetsp:Transcript_150476/g.262172  ORF Transcript_150476/g.262172 Transcript_150476/m.262172 type:complete len:126 (+) Transcript_150476:403-780(+)
MWLAVPAVDMWCGEPCALNAAAGFLPKSKAARAFHVCVACFRLFGWLCLKLECIPLLLYLATPALRSVMLEAPRVASLDNNAALLCTLTHSTEKVKMEVIITMNLMLRHIPVNVDIKSANGRYEE